MTQKVAILQAGNGQRFEFDGEMNGSVYTISNEVASHPIAFQAPVTEHVQPLQDTFTVTLRIVGVRTTLLPQFVNGPGGVDRFAAAFEFFKRNQTQVFTYFSPVYGEIKDLVLVSCPYPRTNVQHVDFACDFRVVRTAQIRTVQIPPERKKKPKGEGKKDKGEAGQTDVLYKPQTALLRATNAGGERFNGGQPLIRTKNQALGIREDDLARAKDIESYAQRLFAPDARSGQGPVFDAVGTSKVVK